MEQEVINAARTLFTSLRQRRSVKEDTAKQKNKHFVYLSHRALSHILRCFLKMYSGNLVLINSKGIQLRVTFFPGKNWIGCLTLARKRSLVVYTLISDEFFK